MSVDGGKAEVGGTQSNRRDRPGTDIRLNKGWRASLFSVNRISGKIGFWTITTEMVIGKEYRPS